MTTNLRVLGLFPGQGSQQVGMGKALYEQEGLARRLFDSADEVLGFRLSEICFGGPEQRLTATEIVQPAILTVSTICYQLAKERLGASLQIVAAAGHSLGEYSALVAAGALDFADAVRLVHKRGTYMQSAVPFGEGKMVAVLGKELGEIEQALNQVEGVAEVANINAPGQIVVSGSAKAIDSFKQILSGAKLIELVVSAPFHCKLMQPAAEKLSMDLDKVSIRPASFPVYANVSAAPVVSADEIRKALKQQVCGRVRWVECMQQAISAAKPELAIEFGNGNVLTGLLKRIDKQLARKNLDSLESILELRSNPA